MKFYIVDAFSEKIFGGNPAGVVLLGKGSDFPPSEIMGKTAAELRYSETAFVKRLDKTIFQLRYFTPAAEVDLCGHATIGTFTALLDAGLIEECGEYKVITSAGDLNVNIQNGFIMMDMAAPELLGQIHDADALAELWKIMGVSTSVPLKQMLKEDGSPLLPTIISTGLPDIIMPVASIAELEALSPDFAALAGISQKYGVVGVHAFALDTAKSGATARCRNFAPLYDIDEEAATGTSSGALTYYLHICDLLPENGQCRFIQGESMGRPSSILCRLSHNDGLVKIQVGGTGTVLAKGDIYL